MIRVEHLRFDYPGTRALDDVGFALAPASVTALVGPNGAGKTTLLRCLAGLDAAQGGRIEIDGIDVGRAPRAAHRQLGFLPDHFGLYGELSALRCLRYAGLSRGLSGAPLEARIAAVARRVGLEGRLDAPAGSLSRGQRQRLALAQAILHRPKVLLLDEPASGLDPEARAELTGLIRGLAAEGMTLVVSSHILAELEAYCTGMLVLSQGRVLEHRAQVGTAAAGAMAPRRRLRIGLAEPPSPELAQALQAAPPAGLDKLIVGGRQIEADTEASDADLPRLLRSLLDQGLPVCAFAVAAPSLQQHYLDTVRAEDGR